MHTHFSALAAVNAFLGTVIIGGVWRLGASHLVASPKPLPKAVGKAMLFQY